MNRLIVCIVYTYTCLYGFRRGAVVESFLFNKTPLSTKSISIKKNHPLVLFVSSDLSSTESDKENVNDNSKRISKKKVCLIDDNVQYHNECKELSISLDLPMLTELPRNDQDNNRFDHILKLVPYESDMISTYALAIQALPQSNGHQEQTPNTRRKKPKRQKRQPMTLPFYVDLCPSKQSKIGKRTSIQGSQQQQQPGSDLLLKATGILKGKKQPRKNEQASSDVADHGSNDEVMIAYDLTAGFGQDSLVMAMSGRINHIIMFERDPVVATLLQDALRRIDLLASLHDGSDENSEVINVAKMLSKCLSLVIGESTELFINDTDDGPLLTTKGEESIPKIQFPPDVVYLDPMFPPRTKSAAVKKNMQILHGLLDTQKQQGQAVTKTKDNFDNSEENNLVVQQNQSQLEEIKLLNTALQIAKSRVVVKRPIKASSLGCDAVDSSSLSPRTPSYAVKGSTSRWDVYVK